MHKIYCIGMLLASVIFSNCYAQLSDIARIDYTNLPGANSGIEYNRTRALFNYPIKLKKEGTYLFLGLDYSNVNLITNDKELIFNSEELDDFQLLDFNIGYTAPLKNDWRLGFRFTPGFSSNLSAKNFSIEDVVLSSDLVFIKDKTKDDTVEKPWRLIFGVSYSGNRGFNFPLPFISYYKKLNKKWSYNLGIPKTNIQYHISKKHRLKYYVELDGFTSNLQSGILLNNNETAESINMSLIISGLQYEYHIAKHVQFYITSAYILDNKVRLRDRKRNNIEALDDSNIIYLRTGIKLKI